MAHRQYYYLVVSLYRSFGAPGNDSPLLHVRSPRCKFPQFRQSAQIDSHAHNTPIIWYRWSWCTSVRSFYSRSYDPHIRRNKWVLNTTTTPLFFLLAQLLIAVVLFVVTSAVGFIKVPLKPDPRKCKGLMPMVLINVIGLRRVPVPSMVASKCAEMILVFPQLEQLLSQICGRIVLPNCARTRPPTDGLLLRPLSSQFTTIRQDIRRLRSGERRILRRCLPRWILQLQNQRQGPFLPRNLLRYSFEHNNGCSRSRHQKESRGGQW